MIKKPKNYKSIVTFAKKVNIDPEYLLGKVYNGDLYITADMPPNVSLNVDGNIFLECIKIGSNSTFCASGDITSTSIQTIPSGCEFSSDGDIIFGDVVEAKTLHINAKKCIYFDKLHVLPQKSKLISGLQIVARKCYKIEDDVILRASLFIDLSSVIVIHSGVEITGTTVDVYNLSKLNNNVTFNVENIEFNSLEYIPKHTVLNVSKLMKIYNVTKIESDVVLNTKEIRTNSKNKIEVVW